MTSYSVPIDFDLKNAVSIKLINFNIEKYAEIIATKVGNGVRKITKKYETMTKF